jgi:eukaryotic-like serine/threonine-protein kinase
MPRSRPAPWPGWLPAWQGYALVGTVDDDGHGYARHFIEPPGEPSKRLALSCFDESALDDMLVHGLDEVRVVDRIVHPNVARLLDMGNHGGVLWHLAEYPRGDTLEALMARAERRGEPLDLGAMVEAFAQFAEGLAAAHETRMEDGTLLGFCYRGLCPDSLLLATEGPCKIVDWGISDVRRAHLRNAVHADAPSPLGPVVSPLGYLAPEHVRALPVDGRTDVFVLGAMLHEVTTGHRPFAGETLFETVKKVLSQPAMPPATLVPGYPAELSDLVLRALDKSPDTRMGVRALAEGLRRAARALRGR